MTSLLIGFAASQLRSIVHFARSLEVIICTN
jgi:hypothetical protein